MTPNSKDPRNQFLANKDSCDGITNVGNGPEIFVGNNTAAWHKMGTVVAGTLNAADALKAANLDWEVRKIAIGDLGIPGKDDDIIHSSDFLVVRQHKHNIIHLGTVTDKYEIIQNVEAFDFFDRLIEEGSAFYETAGSLWAGRKVWIQADVPAVAFGKGSDEVNVKILLANSHDGKGTLTARITPIRVVCNNTFSVAVKGGKNVVKIRHLNGWDSASKIAEARNVLGVAEGYGKALNEQCEKLKLAKVTKDAFVDGYLNPLFPLPEEKSKGRSRMVNIRDEVTALFERGKGNEGKTLWDGFNAVTEYVNHKATYKATGTGGETARNENRFDSVLEGGGSDMMQRAFDLALALA